MNREEHTPIPDPLRERLAQESSDERAELERVWHLLDDVQPSDDVPSKMTTWRAIQDRLDASADDRPPARADRRPARPARRRRVRRTWVAAAAGVLLLLLAGTLVWRQPVAVNAPPGEHVTTTLPDGSSVELNSGTTLSHPRRFSDWPFVSAERRVVRLHGEAFFDVASSTRPFIVETFNARIEVLGTTFNVRARAEDDEPGETHVTLASGQLRVLAAEHPDTAVVLAEAGQSSRVTEAVAATPYPVRIDRTLAWRRQGFAVSDWPLAAIFAELERRYDLDLFVRAPVVLTDSMTLYYPQYTDAETIIHDIAVAKGLTYRTTSRGYEIAPK